MPQEQMGTVKWFDEAKGYGFINCNGVESDIFVHYKHILEEGYRVLYRNELVVFEPVDTSKGIMATKVRKLKHE